MTNHRLGIRARMNKPLSGFLLSTAMLLFFLLMMTPRLGTAGSQTLFSQEKARFSVKFKDEVSPYRVMGVFVLPEEVLTLQALGQNSGDRYLLQAESGNVISGSKDMWRWRAPVKPGLYPVTIVHQHSKDTITLNVFVMVPYAAMKDNCINGYSIGKYPLCPPKRADLYRQPQGFIQVTPKNEDIRVSPHFRLKQFLCKQSDGYPKYLVLKERLLLKLEYILEHLNDRGYSCETFTVMSGFRTPHYNKVIGNVKYSRHLWGEAADIFIDAHPADGIMDDLNRDGRLDYRDADTLYTIINRLTGKSSYKPFIGGLGSYKKTSAHGPFVHVDVRGYQARWNRPNKALQAKTTSTHVSPSM